jgi:predicted GNAT family acetyltransferase
MTDTIRREERDGRGAYVFERDGRRLAAMTFVRDGEKHIVIDHTEVSDELRGQGVGRKLLDAYVAWARESGTKIAATCPYARSVFDKDASIRDVLG